MDDESSKLEEAGRQILKPKPTKEDAEKAMEALSTVEDSVEGPPQYAHLVNESLQFLRDFIEASKSWLPSTAAYERKRAQAKRKRQKD